MKEDTDDMIDDEKITKMHVAIGDHHMQAAVSDEELETISDNPGEQDEYIKRLFDRMVDEVLQSRESER